MSPSKETVRIPALSAKQQDKEIRTGVVHAKDLARLYNSKVAVVDVWSESNPNGYQRALSQTRARAFAKYIASGNFSPTAILMHIRDKDCGIRFDDDGITIPVPPEGETAEKPLLDIVDGQHRTAGVALGFDEQLLDPSKPLDLPITIWVDDGSDGEKALLEEAEQFVTVNTEAKRIRTDLAHQTILQAQLKGTGKLNPKAPITPGLTKDELTPFTTWITNELAKKPGSTWAGQIVRPNVARNTTGLPSQGQFEDSLLDNYLQAGSVMTFAANVGLSPNDVVDMLSNYWSAVFQLRPEALQTPEDYLVTKTLGIHALNGVIPSIFAKNRDLPKVPTVSEFKKVLAGMGEAFSDEGFWTSEGEAGSYGGGKGAFKNLAAHLVASMK